MCHNKNELRSAVSRYRKLQAQKTRIEQELKEVKAEINEYFDYNKIKPKEKVVGQNFVISFSLCAQSHFNIQRLQEELGENLEFFKDYTEYRRINIK